jgi:4-amino-4-deoxy-L-arabinose transferase-like glycosyltransferase
VPVDIVGPSSTGRRWLAPAGLVLLMGVGFFFRLGQDMPMRHHEALMAETARNMVLGHSVERPDGSRPSPWIVPNFNGSDRLRKTPLPYWLVAGVSCAAGGVNEWTARLPSAVSAAGTVLILLLLLRRWTDRRTAYLGAAMLAANVGFLISAREAQADMLMTFFTTASLAALWMAVERSGRGRFLWLVLAGAAAGLAVLAKGPAPLPTLALPCLVAGAVLVTRLTAARRAGRNVAGERGWALAGAAAGAAIFAAIFLPWLLRVPGAWATVWGETAGHSLADLADAEEPSGLYYLSRLPFLLGPWAIFVAYGLGLAIRGAWRDRDLRAWLLFVLAWLGGTLVGFSVAAVKRDHYILPLFPAAAACAALALRHFLRRADVGAARPDHGLLWLHGVGTAVVGLGAMAAYAVFLIDPGFYLRHGVPEVAVTASMFVPVGVLGVIGVAGGGWIIVLAGRRRLAEAVAVLAALLVIAWVGGWATFWSATDRTVPTVAFGAYVRDHVPPEAPLYYLGSGNRSVIYYAGRNMALVSVGGVRQKIAEGRPFYLVLNAAGYQNLAGVEGLTEVHLTPDLYRPKEGFGLLHFGGAVPAAPQGVTIAF